MLVYAEPRLVFVHIPKSGGSSMARALREAEARYGWQRQALTGGGTHGDIAFVQRTMGEDWTSAATSFAILRNPWARMLSMWRFRLSSAQERIARGVIRSVINDLTDDEIVEQSARVSFADWLPDAVHNARAYGVSMTRKPQISWCRDASGEFVLSRILFLERIDMAFLGSLGIDHFPHEKNLGPIDYRDHYSQRARDHVAHWFAEDIALGDYSY